MADISISFDPSEAAAASNAASVASGAASDAASNASDAISKIAVVSDAASNALSVAGTKIGGDPANIAVSTTAPGTPATNDLWVDTS